MAIKGYDEWKLASPWDYPTEGAEREAEMKSELDDLRTAIASMDDVLRDCLDYFEQRMDAETFPDGSIITNEEMQMSLRIKEVLR